MDDLLRAFNLDPAQGFVAVRAEQLASAYVPPFNPDMHVVIIDLDERSIIEGVRTVLRTVYPREHPIGLLREPGEVPEAGRLSEIDSNITAKALHLPPLRTASAFESLQATVAHLRAPEGCPWDREQTHESLRKHLLEEAYEALEAIDREDLDGLREELGDLLLQILMQAQIANEAGNFNMAQVVAGIQAKLIRRHPHVFGDVELSDVDEVLTSWEHFKQEEKEGGPLDGIPRALPALAQSAELQDRAGRVGFKWPAMDQVRAKVHEELAELEAEASPQARASELGDLLFAIVNYARWTKVDPEAELQRANLRFRERFERLLRIAADQDRTLENLGFGEMMRLWEQTKNPAA